jgi:hypothetical protein
MSGRLKNAVALDIVGTLPTLSLDAYDVVRFHRGRSAYIDVEIRDDAVTIRASKGLVIRLNVSNSFTVEFADKEH